MSQKQEQTLSAAGAILLAGIIAGTLDAIAATLSSGTMKVWYFVASGVFGKATAYSGGTPMIVYGILFHYFIAFTWTVIYFLLYPRIALLRTNVLVSAIVYGLFVWLIMNLLVMPLSNTPPITLKTANVLKGAGILIICIGLPLSLVIGRYYRKRQKVYAGMA
ncbi:MAG: hypothetical protein QM731_24555 [Chitinophagaceae bacterium]